LHAFALENEGWIEIRVSVPKGFDENIIVTFVQEETYDEYAFRVLAINDYVSFTELPAGTYTFDGAFLENSDFRYNVSLTNDTQTFEVSADPDASAVLIELEATYNGDFSEGAGVPSEDTQPTEEETVPETEPVTEPSEEATEPSEETTEPSETEPTEAVESTEPSETTNDTGFSIADRLLWSGIATGIFIGIVLLVAFLLRRHTKNS